MKKSLANLINLIAGDSGFGFVELLISSSILFMSVLAFSSLMVSSLDFMSSTQVKTIAYNLATKSIEELKNQDFSTVTSIPLQTVNSKDNKYTFKRLITVQDLDTSSPPDGKIDYKKVTVTISWSKPYASSYKAVTYLNPYGMVEKKDSPPADTVAPVVDVTEPPNNRTVHDTEVVEITAGDIYGVTKIEYYIDNNLISTVNITNVSPGVIKKTFNWDTTAYGDGIHYVYAKAYDAAGNVGTAQSIGYLVVNTPSNDTVAPTAPGYLNARRSYTLTGAPTNKIDLTWIPAEDNVGVAYYYVDRHKLDGSHSLAWITTSVNFSDYVATTSTVYKYRIFAMDGAGNWSPPSNWAIPDDVQSPSTPTNISVIQKTGQEITFSWSACVDDIGVDHYNVYGVPVPPYLEDPLVVAPTSPTVEATINYPAGVHDWTFYITAVDTGGHESNYSRPITWHSY